MRRSRRNATILLFTCSIRKTEKSWITHLFSAVEWIMFSPLRDIVSSQPLPDPFAQRASSPVGPFILSSMLPPCAVPPPQCCPLPTLGCLLPSLPATDAQRKKERGQQGQQRSKREGEERKVNQGKICVAPGEEEIHPLFFFPLYLDSILVQITKSKLQQFCSVSVSQHTSRSIAFC
jgi:hypothetical protein